MNAERLFDNHLAALRRTHRGELWRILLTMVEREFDEESISTFRRYVAEPNRAEAELVKKYRTIYLARHAAVGLNAALANKAAFKNGGNKRGKEKAAEGQATAAAVYAIAKTLREAGRDERELASIIAPRLKRSTGHVRRLLR